MLTFIIGAFAVIGYLFVGFLLWLAFFDKFCESFEYEVLSVRWMASQMLQNYEFMALMVIVWPIALPIALGYFLFWHFFDDRESIQHL